jgi:XTP/dITP diphosphohydrolase
VLATSNRGKLDELRTLLGPSGIEFIGQNELGVSSPEETGSTFVENAILKARHAALQTGLPAVADDSGLVVEVLDGAPGIRSARFAGPGCSDGDNIAKLLGALRDEPPDCRRAYFHCVLVALRGGADPAPRIAQGRWDGLITLEPSGEGGFGYDSIFFDPGLGMTAAELPPETKNRVSHRGKALMTLVELLRER